MIPQLEREPTCSASSSTRSAASKLEQGAGAVPGQATTLAEHLYGFELMVGPYAVSELRVSRALRDRRREIASGRHASLPDRYAREVQTRNHCNHRFSTNQWQNSMPARWLSRTRVPVIVCLGNPPYDRHEAATEANQAQTGGWVRHGEGEERPILEDFLAPARSVQGMACVSKTSIIFTSTSGAGPCGRSLSRVERRRAGRVSFISASSYLDGDAFCGMREQMRRQCDEIWILDLGGEGRGTRRDENVFDIQTPVAIAVAFRAREAKTDTPARVHYARVEGTRKDKLAALDDITCFSKVEWQECPEDWLSPFRPPGVGDYFAHPLLADLMPWQQSGVKAGRTWVVAPEIETLSKRWRILLQAEGEGRRILFKDSPTGRKAHDAPTQLPPSQTKLIPILSLEKDDRAPNLASYAYRSFDRQFLLCDARLLDRPGPALWERL